VSGAPRSNNAIYGNLRLVRDVEYLATPVDGVAPCTTPYAISVAYSLALAVNADDGYRTVISQSALARRTGWSLRSVQRGLNELEASDLISRVKRRDKTDRTTVLVSNVRAHALAARAAEEGYKASPPPDTLAAASDGDTELRTPATPSARESKPKTRAAVPSPEEQDRFIEEMLKVPALKRLAESDHCAVAKALCRKYSEAERLSGLKSLNPENLGGLLNGGATNPVGLAISVISAAIAEEQKVVPVPPMSVAPADEDENGFHDWDEPEPKRDTVQDWF
jgi:DNA-binding MarR family transcriptional regulator